MTPVNHYCSYIYGVHVKSMLNILCPTDSVLVITHTVSSESGCVLDWTLNSSWNFLPIYQHFNLCLAASPSQRGRSGRHLHGCRQLGPRALYICHRYSPQPFISLSPLLTRTQARALQLHWGEMLYHDAFIPG